MLSILRYGSEVRAAEPYFDRLTPKADREAVALASELIKRMSGGFEPEKMPDEYSRAVHELVKAKLEHRAPQVMIETDGKPKAPVINIMDALKKSMQRQGQAKVRDTVRKRMGKAAPKEEAPRPTRTRAGARRSLHYFQHSKTFGCRTHRIGKAVGKGRGPIGKGSNRGTPLSMRDKSIRALGGSPSIDSLAQRAKQRCEGEVTVRHNSHVSLE
jgi:hypothetical protein